MESTLIGKKMKNTKINLCDTCIYLIPECEGCGSDEIEFGDGVGNDNIIICPYHDEGTKQLLTTNEEE